MEIEKQFEKSRLTACESIIMKEIWDYEEDYSIPELTETLRIKYNRDYARTTVVTFLLKLSDKRFVTTYRKGKYRYVHALKDKNEYVQKMISEELDFWFNGDKGNIMFI